MSPSWLQMLPAILVVHQFIDVSLPSLPLSSQGISLCLSSHGHLFCCFLLFVWFFLLLFLVLAVLQGLWELSFLTRGQTCGTLSSKSMELNQPLCV